LVRLLFGSDPCGGAYRNLQHHIALMDVLARLHRDTRYLSGHCRRGHHRARGLYLAPQHEIFNGRALSDRNVLVRDIDLPGLVWHRGRANGFLAG